jgi:hypothetical protein
MSFACFAANGISYYYMKKNGCKASKGVQERTAANDDELVDI